MSTDEREDDASAGGTQRREIQTETLQALEDEGDDNIDRAHEAQLEDHEGARMADEDPRSAPRSTRTTSGLMMMLHRLIRQALSRLMQPLALYRLRLLPMIRREGPSTARRPSLRAKRRSMRT